MHCLSNSVLIKPCGQNQYNNVFKRGIAVINKGQLVRWNDSKGYGFIRVENAEEGCDVFIHMSALQHMARRPLVGDILYFQIETQADAKQRAFSARIEGVESNPETFEDGTEPIKTNDKKALDNQVEPAKSIKGMLYRIAIMLVVLAIASFVYNRVSTPNNSGAYSSSAYISSAVAADEQQISQAFSQQRSGIQVQSAGVVSRLLPDDNKGSRHQRFIITLSSGQTLLIAHNIDLAAKIDSLKIGDRVLFKGEYEYNDRGGVVHWTHHDPKGRHVAGWLKHQGQTYQ
ncbi:DNA-binding protein [Shewanella sp. Choline-02u-19]|nr:DNA-binding protein [Shewanella sp. GutCb]PKH56708.1 DNA-binding protein [Shewanella sp. Bg11-22]PKI30259.1 DNA-binding protein [Shewanella sp. Choline-02u-19]